MEPELITNKPNLPRRSFLQYAATGVAAGVATIASCKKAAANKYDVGTNDVGILNFAYALEQLEAAFYTQVIASPYSGISTFEMSRLTDVRDHEVCHMQFFKAALGTNAIPSLATNFSSINFASRASVLAAAQAFEDTGVQAYNGSIYLIANPSYITAAAEVVSVEARHSSFIRNLISAGSFADSTILDANGLDQAKTIAQVLPIANMYLTTQVSANNYGYVAS
jgi:hypothetical protein